MVGKTTRPRHKSLIYFMMQLSKSKDEKQGTKKISQATSQMSVKYAISWWIFLTSLLIDCGQSAGQEVNFTAWTQSKIYTATKSRLGHLHSSCRTSDGMSSTYSEFSQNRSPRPENMTTTDCQ